MNIITNGTDGFAKMNAAPLEMAAAGATSLPAGSAPTLALDSASGALVQTAGSDEYYPLNVNLTVNATFETAIAASTLTGGLKIVENTSSGATVTATASKTIVAGAAVAKGEVIPVTVKVTDPTGVVQIKLETADLP